MKLLMISTDWRIAVLGSKEHIRMSSYATVTEELHIIVFTLKSQGLKESHSGNLYIYPTNSIFKLFFGIRAYFLSSKIKKRGVTLVTAQDPFETGLIGLKISKKLKTPFQVQLHTDFASTYYGRGSFKNSLRIAIADYVIPKANCVRVVSKRLQKDLVARYGLKKEPFVLPIHLDIPMSILSQHQDLLHLKYPKFGTVMLMTSRIEKEKNIIMAIKCFYNIYKHYSGVGLVILGDGSLREGLESFIKKIGMEEVVIFEGWSNDTSKYFLSADLFLNTSDYEGYGRTLMEAAAAECPIITTDVGIVGEILTDKNALISAPQDEVAFQNNMEFALKNKNIMKEKGKLARNAVDYYMSITEESRLSMYKQSWEECSI